MEESVENCLQGKPQAAFFQQRRNGQQQGHRDKGEYSECHEPLSFVNERD